MPCHVIDVRRAPAWLEQVENAVMDYELLRAFQRTRHEAAVVLLSQEIRSL